MSNGTPEETTVEMTTEKRTKMVQIIIMFKTSSDDDALAAKAGIDTVLTGRKGVAVQFNIHDQPAQR